jgi:cytochrome c oxidase cbb3-type subunit I/II
VGGKYPNLWHYLHMNEPTSMSPGSLMPPYPWLLRDELDVSLTPRKISTMRSLGVPYASGYEDRAVADLRAQAEVIAADITKAGMPADPSREIIALIAYLQRLGVDIKVPVAGGMTP